MATTNHPISDSPKLSTSSAVKPDRFIIYTSPPSALRLSHDIPSDSLTASICESEKTRASIIKSSTSAIRSFFSISKASPNRLIYVTAGLAFDAASPKPFGGPKAHPGYAEFEGTTVASLLHYLVEASFKRYWAYRGREALDFVVGCVNQARELQYAGNADILNELMLKGMKKAGHIPWNALVTIPEALRHRQETRSDAAISEVQFTPRLGPANKPV
ncbi:hypothetical protein BJ741DRAFT_286323 [Chytriomyces cf. hyalinus JEL632]|nr:hypothetical protein BJ741DRAFT_286323 [Chytriomyces cf. hyalinus JEL632]